MEEEYDFEKAKQIAAEREMKKEKKKKKKKGLVLTVLIERESLFTILTDRERFLLNSNG
jgi:hypothetical protein